MSKNNKKETGDNKNERFLLERTPEGGVIRDTLTGNTMSPSCYGDLEAYCAYLRCHGQTGKIQQMLEDVMSGKRVITDMINSTGRFDSRVLRDSLSVRIGGH